MTHKLCTALLVSLLATCSTSPSYAQVDLKSNSDFLTELNKINVMPSSIDVDLVAVSVNNGYQELRKLCKSVQHHTIVDVFLCLLFISLPVMGEFCLAIALFALWWGGLRNKPFIGRILRAVDLRFSNLPAALHLGQPIKKTSPFEKV